MEAVSTPSRTQMFENSPLQFSKIIRQFNSIFPILIGAIVLFEIFNYSTTEHALSDTMGGLGFLGGTRFSRGSAGDNLGFGLLWD